MPRPRQIWILLIVALAARLAVFFLLSHHYGTGSFYLANNGAALSDNDSQNYVTIAKNLVEHGVYSRFALPPFSPDSFRTPLLPLFFAPIVYAFGFARIWVGILILNILLAGTSAAGFYLAKLLVREKLALWFGTILALEPLLVYRSAIAEPDALIVLLLLLASYWFVRFWQEQRPKFLYLAAVYLSLLALAKPVGVYLIFIAGVFAAVRYFRFRHLAMYFLISLAILSPWLYRNHAVFGRWSMSSVTAYNFYNYYTDKIRLPDEKWPASIVGRDPLRDLRNEQYFLGASLSRIKNRPVEFVKQQTVGMIRNFFAGDLVGVRNNGHGKILPFAYDSVHDNNLTALALSGKYREFLRGLFVSANLITLVSYGLFGIFYFVVLWHWTTLYRADRGMFILFAMFLVMSLYFVAAAGNFVDAKYRLPALPLLGIVFFHFLEAKT